MKEIIHIQKIIVIHIPDIFWGHSFWWILNILDFVPHVRLMDEGFSNPETAKQFGLPYVIIRKVRPYDTATLNYNWQVWETLAFSLYTTTTSRIDPNSAGQAVLAVMNFLSGQGMIKYNVPDRIHFKVVHDEEMFLI